MPGLYLHIPFCRQACNYCDFYFSTSLSNKTEVIGAIIKEIELRSHYLGQKEIDSIYFGGGTPSLLSREDLSRILSALNSKFSWNADAEITLEANPDDINENLIKQWIDIGINRLSIGLQSFNNDELRWMNRVHTAEESVSSVKVAQDGGFNNISIDLIYGSKFQTLASWELTLDKAINLHTQHISSYNLTIESKTVLGLKNQRGQEPAIDDDFSGKQFLMLIDKLERAEFVQYEISNFGKAGYFAIHNSNYWRQQNYLGLGPSAHSFDGSSRQWNVKNNSIYIRAINSGNDFFEKEMLSLNDRYNEYVLTRLRTIWGCDREEIKTLFGEDVLNHFNNTLKQFKGFIEEKNGLIVLNHEGRLRADGIASDLFIL